MPTSFREQSKKAKLKIENSEYQIQEIRSRALPQITANGNLTHNPIIQTTVIWCRIWTARHNNSSRFWTKWISTAGVLINTSLV
jgi:outer membrane protein TolC